MTADGDRRDSRPGVIRLVAEHSSALALVGTALGFVLGGVLMRQFARGLGVSLGDLGLDVRDTVFIALATMSVPICFAGGVAVGLATSQPVLIASIGTIVGFAVFGFFFSTEPKVFFLVENPGQWWFVWVVLGLTPLVLVVALTIIRNFPNWAWAVAGVQVMAATALGGWLSFDQADSYVSALKSSGDGIIDVPFAYDMVLPVTRGELTVTGETRCVDRLGQQVMLGADYVEVVPQWDSFIANKSCSRDQQTEPNVEAEDLSD